MEPWQQWRDMAVESMQSAEILEDSGYWRSSTSRYYYATYQMMTALLLYCKLTPPEEREAWSHDDTPTILRQHLNPLIPSRDRRNDLANRLSELYKARIIADYLGTVALDEKRVNTARKDAGYMVKLAEKILPAR
jgi:uncharacterized protein (UPF0332 family)